MKKQNVFAVAAGAMLGVAVGAMAGVDAVIIVNDQTIAVQRAYTNAFSLNGRVEGVVVAVDDIANRTNTVAITSVDGQTIFSKSCVSGTNFYPILTPAVDYAGSTINESTVAATTNRVYTKFATASKVKCIVTGADQDGGLTNSVTVKIYMDR